MNIRHLLDRLRTRQLVPCLGPELRVAAGLRSLPEVLTACVEDLNLGIADSARLSGTPAQAFRVLHGLVPHASLRHRVHRLLDDANARTPAVARAIVRLAPAVNLVLTTNIDRVLYRAFAGNWPELTPMAVQPFHAGVLVTACGSPHSADAALTYESLFGAEGEQRRRDLQRILAGQVLLFVGYAPDDEALRFLTACGAVITGHALVPAGRASANDYFPAGVERIPVEEPFDVNAARLLDDLAEAYSEQTLCELPTSGDEVPLTRVKARPFPGLEPYSASNQNFYCGREEDVERLVVRLQAVGQSCWCHIEGISGVGKSSFVRAGLRPRFEVGDPLGGDRRWLVAQVRPGYDPIGALMGALHGCISGLAEFQPDWLAREVLREPQTLSTRLESTLLPEEGLLLIVDPLDEVLTLCSPEQAEAFAHALDYAVARTQRRVIVVTTLRSDFAEMMPRLPALHERMRRSDADFRRFNFVLPPLSRIQLSDALRRAARRGGLEFEPGLVDSLLADTDLEHGSSESIHVLSNVAAVLDRLWDQLGDGTLLTHKAYRGVENALTHAADDVVAPLIDDFGETALRTLFLSLVIVVDGSPPVRRQLARRDLVSRISAIPKSKTLDVEALLAALTGRDPRRARESLRLVSVGRDHVELVHDALLRGWLRLSRWIDMYHEELLQTEALCQAARRWEFFGEPEVVAAHDTEANYFIAADPIDERSRKFKATLQDSHRALFERGREIADMLVELRDSIVPRFLTATPPLMPLVDEVKTGLGRALELHRPSPGQHPQSVLLIQRELDRGASVLTHHGAHQAYVVYQQAQRMAARYFRQAPHDREIIQGLASTLLRLGDVELQLGRVRDACHHLQRARRAYELLLTQLDQYAPEEKVIVNDFLAVLVLLADAELGRGELALAREILGVARSVAAARERLLAPGKFALILTRMASVALRRNQVQEARELLIEALGRAPDTGFVLDSLATLELRPDGNPDAARNFLARGVALAREAISLVLGKALRKIKREVVRQVGIPLSRELALCIVRLAGVKSKLGDNVAARADLQEAYLLTDEICKCDHSIRARRDHSRCLDRLGMVAQAMDDQVTALAHFEAALELDRDCVAFDPDNLRARHALAIALYRCGAAAVKLRQCELARSYFQRALDQCNLLTGYPQIEALIREIEVRLGEPCP